MLGVLADMFVMHPAAYALRRAAGFDKDGDAIPHLCELPLRQQLEPRLQVQRIEDGHAFLFRELDSGEDDALSVSQACNGREGPPHAKKFLPAQMSFFGFKIRV